MKEFLTTNGRFGRLTFWAFFICLFALLGLIGFISESASFPQAANNVLGLLMFPFLIMGIIVQVKRWHDRNKSGWWVLISLIPIVGSLWILVECGFLKGTQGPNRFGPDPLA